MQEKLHVSEAPKPPPRKAEPKRTTEDEEMDPADAKLSQLNAELGGEADTRQADGCL